MTILSSKNLTVWAITKRVKKTLLPNSTDERLANKVNFVRIRLN